jgi:hypothetical protein
VTQGKRLLTGFIPVVEREYDMFPAQARRLKKPLERSERIRVLRFVSERRDGNREDERVALRLGPKG